MFMVTCIITIISKTDKFSFISSRLVVDVLLTEMQARISHF